MVNTKTYSIKDFILDEKTKEELDDSKRGAKRTKKSKPWVRYAVVMESGCDFVVERSVGHSGRKARMVVLVSQNQYYFEENDVRHPFTKSHFWQFLKDLKNDIIHFQQVNWIPYLSNEANVRMAIFEILQMVHENESAAKLVRRGYLYYDPNTYFSEKLCYMGIYVETEEKHVIPQSPFNRLGHYMANDLYAMPTRLTESEYRRQYFFECRYLRYNPWQVHQTWDNMIVPEYWSNMKNTVSYESQPPEFMDHGISMSLLLYFYEASPQLYISMINLLAKHDHCSRRELFERYLFQEDTREQRILYSFFSFLLIKKIFGLEWARKAIEKYIAYGVESVLPYNYLTKLFYGETSLEFKKEDEYDRLELLWKFEPEAFLEYFLHTSVQQGFSDSIHDYIALWDNILIIQQYLYGKVKEKYPDNLASVERKLRYQVKKNDRTIYQNMWKEVSRRMKRFEYKGEKYQIICPMNMKDLMDESMAQSNCVDTYEGKILGGDEMIFFMRSADPEIEKKSILTIEVFRNKTLGDVLGKYNEPPTSEQMKFVAEWAKAKNITLLPEHRTVQWEDDEEIPAS